MARAEAWVGVVGFTDYEVSDRGRVRSWRPPNGQGGAPAEPRLFRCSRRKRGGYVIVGLACEGRTCHRFVHVLVLEAFVGPCPDGMETRHGNRLENLSWGTPAQNAADRDRHGTQLRGEAHPNAKYTEAVVRAARRMRRGGMAYRAIGAVLGMSEPTVVTLAKGRRWAWLDD